MHRILCVGAGAVGGYYGARLIESGADVTYLVRERRRDNLAEHGLRVESCYGNFARPVQAIVKSELSGPFDLILLTCKAYDLADAIDAIAPAVGRGTAILPLLNGVAHVDLLNAAYGRNTVLSGAAKIADTLLPDGAIKHLNDWNFITFGEQDGAMSERVRSLKAAFDKTPVVAAAVPNIMQMMWEKLVHLATLSGMTAAMRANVGEILRAQEGGGLMAEFLERNAEIARREGYPPSAQWLAECQKLISNVNSPHTTSMARDIENKGPIEADHIIGYMLRRAVAHKVDPTLHRMVFAHLQAYEQRRAAGRQL
jgi:2-dehydropantoate 2-reductase